MNALVRGLAAGPRVAAKEKTQNVVVLPPVLLQLAATWRIAAGCNAHTRPSQNRRMLACTLPATVDGALPL